MAPICASSDSDDGAPPPPPLQGESTDTLRDDEGNDGADADRPLFHRVDLTKAASPEVGEVHPALRRPSSIGSIASQKLCLGRRNSVMQHQNDSDSSFSTILSYDGPVLTPTDVRFLSITSSRALPIDISPRTNNARTGTSPQPFDENTFRLSPPTDNKGKDRVQNQASGPSQEESSQDDPIQEEKASSGSDDARSFDTMFPPRREPRGRLRLHEIMAAFRRTARSPTDSLETIQEQQTRSLSAISSSCTATLVGSDSYLGPLDELQSASTRATGLNTDDTEPQYGSLRRFRIRRRQLSPNVRRLPIRINRDPAFPPDMFSASDASPAHVSTGRNTASESVASRIGTDKSTETLMALETSAGEEESVMPGAAGGPKGLQYVEPRPMSDHTVRSARPYGRKPTRFFSFLSEGVGGR